MSEVRAVATVTCGCHGLMYASVKYVLFCDLWSRNCLSYNQSTAWPFVTRSPQWLLLLLSNIITVVSSVGFTWILTTTWHALISQERTDKQIFNCTCTSHAH